MRRFVTFIGTAFLAISLSASQHPAAAEPSKDIRSAAPRTYQIQVDTGTASGAGTDARVWVFLRGNRGGTATKSGVMELNSSADDFESGETDLFNKSIEDLGTITQICIQRDDSGLFDDWYLADVRVISGEFNNAVAYGGRFGGWLPVRTWICRTATRR
jgi:hypothetical protein